MRLPLSTVPDTLHAFEGRVVLNNTIKVTNAGDGLSKAMGLENAPGDLAIGAKVHVVLECEVAGIGFVKVKDTDGLVRVQTLKAGRSTFVEADFVEDALREQDLRLEKAAGISRLFNEDGDPVEPDPAPDAE